MADSKISALPASTVPLAGTEVLPIVQSSTTKQVSVANLTAGRAISATQITLTTGSVIVASGQGVDFSATPGTGTSELFADYEEGTWTPVVTSSAGSITSYTSSGNYTKVGNTVVISGFITITNNGTGTGNGVISGLPFTVGGQGGSGCSRSAAAGGHMVNIQILSGGTTFTMWTYANLYPFLTSSELAFSFVYIV
jgi:hypothetical protein